MGTAKPPTKETTVKTSSQVRSSEQTTAPTKSKEVKASKIKSPGIPTKKSGKPLDKTSPTKDPPPEKLHISLPLSRHGQGQITDKENRRQNEFGRPIIRANHGFDEIQGSQSRPKSSRPGFPAKKSGKPSDKTSSIKESSEKLRRQISRRCRTDVDGEDRAA